MHYVFFDSVIVLNVQITYIFIIRKIHYKVYIVVLYIYFSVILLTFFILFFN